MSNRDSDSVWSEECTTHEVREFVAEHEPVEQDTVVEEFGNRGLAALKQLMSSHEVSYSRDWKIITEDSYGK